MAKVYSTEQMIQNFKAVKDKKGLQYIKNNIEELELFGIAQYRKNYAYTIERKLNVDMLTSIEIAENATKAFNKLRKDKNFMESLNKNTAS